MIGWASPTCGYTVTLFWLLCFWTDDSMTMRTQEEVRCLTACTLFIRSSLWCGIQNSLACSRLVFCEAWESHSRGMVQCLARRPGRQTKLRTLNPKPEALRGPKRAPLNQSRLVLSITVSIYVFVGRHLNPVGCRWFSLSKFLTPWSPRYRCTRRRVSDGTCAPKPLLEINRVYPILAVVSPTI